jgi:thiosulfate dehydrogenase
VSAAHAPRRFRATARANAAATAAAALGVIATGAVAFTAGCRGPGASDAVAYGEGLFNSPSMSTSLFNHFSCATCHAATSDPTPGRIYAGYPLANVAFRDGLWGGYEPTLRDAASFCLVFFMRGEPLASDDLRGRALYEYLASLSPDDPSPALPLTVVETVEEVDRGDPARGRAVYDAACHNCHGTYPGGHHRLDRSIPRLVDQFETYPEHFPGIDPALVIVEKVRHGQFFGVGGVMPLYSREALSDEDLGALIAYLGF